jgi:hypothetical protein
MSGTIPASALVNVTPGVLAAGGTGLTIAGMMMSQNALTGATPTSYASASAVSAVYGPTATETLLATQYFNGYIGGFTTPGILWIASAGTSASPGVPGTSMANVIAFTQNWATFFLAYTETPANLLLYAEWASQQNNRYAAILVDTDASAITSTLASTALEYGIKQASYSGTVAIWVPSADETDGLLQAAWLSGFAASLQFTRFAGRTNPAGKGAAGLTPTVTNQTVANNLLANGYCFYGAYAEANQPFQMFQNGQISGIFEWFDTYICQIWMNSYFRSQLMLMLQQMPLIPYNTAGYAIVDEYCQPVITAALNFGAIQPGVTLSSSQAADANAQAGKTIDPILSSRGWYLQIQPASATTRQARQSPTITFWYTDGESIQQIALASIEIQ